MLDCFTRHPRSVGETYTTHLATAWRFGGTMAAAGLACLLHGVFPFAFERTASRCVARLHREMCERGPGAAMGG